VVAADAAAVAPGKTVAVVGFNAEYAEVKTEFAEERRLSSANSFCSLRTLR
jgi:hypothetical protein